MGKKSLSLVWIILPVACCFSFWKFSIRNDLCLALQVSNFSILSRLVEAIWSNHCIQGKPLLFISRSSFRIVIPVACGFFISQFLLALQISYFSFLNRCVIAERGSSRIQFTTKCFVGISFSRIVFPVTFSFFITQLFIWKLFLTLNISLNTIFSKVVIAIWSTDCVEFDSLFLDAFGC